MSCSEKILTESETLSYVSKMIISSSARVLRLSSPFFFFFPYLTKFSSERFFPDSCHFLDTSFKPAKPFSDNKEFSKQQLGGSLIFLFESEI